MTLNQTIGKAGCLFCYLSILFYSLKKRLLSPD
uniref:Uncharacterized protein n=1 Tax=Arundo donax TaxID=35708 RepID=A0A0A9ECG7_ARUDO